MSVRRWLFAWSVSLAASACGGGEDEVGESTSATCPDSSTLTYETDIAPILAMYCVRCHATSVSKSARHGAPSDHNFDSELGVLEEATHVDQVAGSDGTITNTEMPPKGYPAPSVQERMKLSEWLACNAPPNTTHTH